MLYILYADRSYSIDDLVNLVAHPGLSWIHAMRRKPGIAGLIKEREQQSALSAVGEQIEDPGLGSWAPGMAWHG